MDNKLYTSSYVPMKTTQNKQENRKLKESDMFNIYIN